MSHTLTEINREIARLATSSEYRRAQKVWAEESQLKNMKRLATRAHSLSAKDAQDLVRVVSDSASLTSRIMQLAEQHAREVEPMS